MVVTNWSKILLASKLHLTGKAVNDLEHEGREQRRLEVVVGKDTQA